MSNQQPPFIHGLKLSELYYREAVQSILGSRFPGLRHSAALIGSGSDVIGYDDARSRDHMWGPRTVLFLPEDDFAQTSQAVDEALRQNLPTSFYGYPTSFGPPDEIGVRVLQPLEHGPVDHLIEIQTIPEYFNKQIAWDTRHEPTPPEWLTFSEHKLLTLTTGGVWHDEIGLEAVRKQIAYYPHDIWLYLLACEWMKIGQEEPFVGRTAEAGDEVGSRILAARMVKAVMYLCFLMERVYSPYSKWFGSAFSKLEIAPLIQPHLAEALIASNFTERERQLSRAYEICAWRFNSLDIIPQVTGKVSFFYERPFKVIHGGEIAEKIMQLVQNETLKSVPGYAGSVNQLSESTDVVAYVEVCKRLRSLYE
jgi:hypothetical protein